MLSNACFLAKFRFDTAENEPGKVCRIPATVPSAPAELGAHPESVSEGRLGDGSARQVQAAPTPHGLALRGKFSRRFELRLFRTRATGDFWR